MHEAQSFIANYSGVERARIAFAWNGKHATEFADANQVFRWTIVEHCLAERSEASPLLLAHLFLADAEWSSEAWEAPHHFAQLGALLLQRGQINAIAPFSEGLVHSFDTLGACCSMELSRPLLAQLSSATMAALVAANDEVAVKRLTSARDLFAKLADGTATQGRATVASGTPVSDVRIVWPRWYHKLWAKVTGMLGRDET